MTILSSSYMLMQAQRRAFRSPQSFPHLLVAGNGSSLLPELSTATYSPAITNQIYTSTAPESGIPLSQSGRDSQRHKTGKYTPR